MSKYSDSEKLEDIKLILSRMHHFDYLIHTDSKECQCSIYIDGTMIISGKKPKVLEVFKSGTEEAAGSQVTHTVCKCSSCEALRKG